MVWLFLILAIVLEVGAALSLRLATGGRKLFYIAVVVGYLGAFFFLTQVLALGLGIGVAYGIWAASGVIPSGAKGVPCTGRAWRVQRRGESFPAPGTTPSRLAA